MALWHIGHGPMGAKLYYTEELEPRVLNLYTEIHSAQDGHDTIITMA